MNIHLVESAHGFVKLKDANLWESGGWILAEEDARKLVGGNIFFHKKRSEPSFYGGKIIRYRRDDLPGRIVFVLEYHQGFRDIRTDKGGWNKSVKITDRDPDPAG